MVCGGSQVCRVGGAAKVAESHVDLRSGVDADAGGETIANPFERCHVAGDRATIPSCSVDPKLLCPQLETCRVDLGRRAVPKLEIPR